MACDRLPHWHRYRCAQTTDILFITLSQSLAKLLLNPNWPFLLQYFNQSQSWYQQSSIRHSFEMTDGRGRNNRPQRWSSCAPSRKTQYLNGKIMTTTELLECRTPYTPPARFSRISYGNYRLSNNTKYEAIWRGTIRGPYFLHISNGMGPTG